jgi:hypothetical protein
MRALALGLLALAPGGCATTTVTRDGKQETVLCERDLKATPWSWWDLLAIPALAVAPFTVRCEDAR